MYQVQSHPLAQEDFEMLKKAGKAKLVARAVKKIEMIAGMSNPAKHNNVLELDEDAPVGFAIKTATCVSSFALPRVALKLL